MANVAIVQVRRVAVSYIFHRFARFGVMHGIDELDQERRRHGVDHLHGKHQHLPKRKPHRPMEQHGRKPVVSQSELQDNNLLSGRFGISRADPEAPV
jgi:hypothetical protein